MKSWSRSAKSVLSLRCSSSLQVAKARSRMPQASRNATVFFERLDLVLVLVRSDHDCFEHHHPTFLSEFAHPGHGSDPGHLRQQLKGRTPNSSIALLPVEAEAHRPSADDLGSNSTQRGTGQRADGLNNQRRPRQIAWPLDLKVLPGPEPCLIRGPPDSRGPGCAGAYVPLCAEHGRGGRRSRRCCTLPSSSGPPSAACHHPGTPKGADTPPPPGTQILSWVPYRGSGRGRLPP